MCLKYEKQTINKYTIFVYIFFVKDKQILPKDKQGYAIWNAKREIVNH